MGPDPVMMEMAAAAGPPLVILAMGEPLIVVALLLTVLGGL